MRRNVETLPDDLYHVRQLLLVLTLSPSAGQQEVEFALDLAKREPVPDSTLLARYRALAFSQAGHGEWALKCVAEQSEESRDAIDALVEAYARAESGDVAQARLNLKTALKSIDEGQAVNFVDCGPLTERYLISVVSRRLGHEDRRSLAPHRRERIEHER